MKICVSGDGDSNDGDGGGDLIMVVVLMVVVKKQDYHVWSLVQASICSITWSNGISYVQGGTEDSSHG